MTIYTIKYETENNYNSPVNEAYLNFLIVPEETDEQRCLNLYISNSLQSKVQFSDSLYGFKSTLFHLKGPFTSFNLSMSVVVEKKSFSFPVFKNLSIADEKKIVQDELFKIKNNDFIIQTKLTEVGYSQLPSETVQQSNETIFKYVQRINSFVQHFLIYETEVTNAQTSVKQVLEIKKGVCQDYSHLFISIMRNNSIPARYVSGYLNQGKQYIGAAAMHAWVEVYIPGTGWLGIDPTNNVFVNENYIKVSHGSDYIDCMPVKGIYLSDSGGTTSHTVEITEQQNQ